MLRKKNLLYPIRKTFTFFLFPQILASLLKKWPESRLLRGICPSNKLFSKHKIVVAKRYGYYFEMDLSDYMDWLLFFHSKTDSSLYIQTFVNEGDTVLDIGGNIGQTALFFSRKVGNNGKVISFEPFPKTFKRFEKNLSLNKGIKNIKLEMVALGDSNEVLKMHSGNKGNSGQNRIIQQGADESDAFEVKVMTLNDYIKQNTVDKIDFIKIDVEGFEYKALSGSNEIINKHKPKLFIELNDANLKQQGNSANQLLTMLGSWGYKAMDAMTNLEVKSLSSGHIDIICYPK